MVVAGCAIFSLGFNLFLEPHDTNCGGLSGLAQVLSLIHISFRLTARAKIAKRTKRTAYTAVCSVRAPVFPATNRSFRSRARRA